MNDKSNTTLNLPRATYPGTIITIKNDLEIKEALSHFESVTSIGFDTETKPSFKKGETYQVSLLQLASENHALLFRLHFLKDFSAIKELFENPHITKAGVAIRDDIRSLQRLFAFEPKGFVELADLAHEKRLKNFGLKGMTEEVLGLSLSKKAKLSNWESRDLKDDQLQYAATDAWIGLELYLALRKKH